jgi:hypothetical protein
VVALNRTELINHLLADRGGSRYLEIGVRNEDDNFAHVEAPTKVGVDTSPVTTVHGSSDEFFAQNYEKFDLIFIDGLHVEEQVSRDIGASYRCLAPGGVIVLHDCLPPDAWHQRPPEQFTEGESWNGEVWKAVLREFNRTEHRCFVVEADWGCGVIDTAQRQDPPCEALPADLSYESHYESLQRFVISISAFIRERVQPFYHLACLNGWKGVFVEQMSALREAGFRAVHLSVLGASDLGEVCAVCEGLGIESRPVFHSPELSLFERPCLRAVQAYVRDNQGYVLYLHSKGVSDPADATKRRWRDLMMSELVGSWESRMGELPHYDAVGVNWMDMPPISHFSGNFWYASTRYLRTLADCETYYKDPRYQDSGAFIDERLGCEFWISSGSTAPNVLSLAYRNANFCDPEFWSERG